MAKFLAKEKLKCLMVVFILLTVKRSLYPSKQQGHTLDKSVNPCHFVTLNFLLI